MCGGGGSLVVWTMWSICLTPPFLQAQPLQAAQDQRQTRDRPHDADHGENTPEVLASPPPGRSTPESFLHPLHPPEVVREKNMDKKSRKNQIRFLFVKHFQQKSFLAVESNSSIFSDLLSQHFHKKHFAQVVFVFSVLIGCKPAIRSLLHVQQPLIFFLPSN